MLFARRSNDRLSAITSSSSPSAAAGPCSCRPSRGFERQLWARTATAAVWIAATRLPSTSESRWPRELWRSAVPALPWDRSLIPRPPWQLDDRTRPHSVSSPRVRKGRQPQRACLMGSVSGSTVEATSQSFAGGCPQLCPRRPCTNLRAGEVLAEKEKARAWRASLKVVVGTYATHVTAHSHAGVTYSFSRRGSSCPTCRREIRRCLRRHLKR
jgi:hypothetical protein